MKTSYLRFLCLLLAALLIPSAGLAEPTDTVVAAEGTIHKVRHGLYSDLFPGGHDAGAEASVLALEVVENGHGQRFLVPGTEDFYAEIPAALHYERNSHTTFVLWQGLVNGIHPFLHLAGYDGLTWSQPLDITGNVFADKASAELVIFSEPQPKKQTRLLESAAGRSLVYVAWEEVSLFGTQKYLVPIVLQDGAYLGWHESFRLSSFVNDDQGNGGQRSRSPVNVDIENLLRIQPSTKDHAVVVGFTNPDTGRLVTLEVDLLPQALSALAAKVETLILESAETSSSVQEIAEKVRAAMMGYDEDFHRSTLEFLAAEIEALLLRHSSVASAVAPGVPEKFGLHMIDIGARVRSKGLIDPAPIEIIQMGQTREGGAPYHHLKVSILADREAPQVGGPAVLFLSSTGLEALVAWEEDAGIVFRETEGADWGERQVVGLSEELNKQDVYRILADRALNR